MNNALNEFKYSVTTFVISITFNISIISILYWIFNRFLFPPIFGHRSWMILGLVLLGITFLVKRKVLSDNKISSFRKNTIIISSLLCTYLMIIFSLEILSNYGVKTLEISTVDNVSATKSIDLKIKSFEIINKPISLAKIVTVRKQVQERKNKHKVFKYAEIYYLYPFKSEKNNIFYCLEFKQKIDKDANEEIEKSELNLLLRATQDSIKNYDFKKIRNFEYLTKMSSEYDAFLETSSLKKNIIFLKPIKEPLQKKANETVLTCLKMMFLTFIIYIAIFFVTKIISNYKMTLK